MLNNILNLQINHNINEFNRINYLNKKSDIFKKEQNIKQEETNNKFKKITINKKEHFSIKQKININYVESKDPEPTDINRQIRKINNVYKLKYMNTQSNGFGDFIRGCFFLLEFCEKYNLELDIHIYDNNIKFLINYFNNKSNINNKIANGVSKFSKINCEFNNKNGVITYNINNDYDDSEFIQFLNKQPIFLNNIFINATLFPCEYISKKHIEYMKYILDPIDPIKIEINNILNNLNIKPKTYITYHIRLGDTYIENQSEYIKKSILDKITRIIDIIDYKNCLLLSDSNSIKNVLKIKYPNIRILTNKICHITSNETEKIKNTLLEFYLMSFSSQIKSFSVYPHGSGFSKWCSVVYEIPYICYYIS
jgi:hypothetical protein